MPHRVGRRHAHHRQVASSLWCRRPLKSFHQHNEHRSLEAILSQLKAGSTFALCSDAGTPGISDPGFLLVRACVEAGVDVECLPGATAFVPALVLSGLPCDRFYFEGFLPTKRTPKTPHCPHRDAVHRRPVRESASCHQALGTAPRPWGRRTASGVEPGAVQAPRRNLARHRRGTFGTPAGPSASRRVRGGVGGGRLKDDPLHVVHPFHRHDGQSLWGARKGSVPRHQDALHAHSGSLSQSLLQPRHRPDFTIQTHLSTQSTFCCPKEGPSSSSRWQPPPTNHWPDLEFSTRQPSSKRHRIDPI